MRRGSSRGGQDAKKITPAEVKELLVEGRSPPIEDFIPKRGNKFAAHLVLSAKKDKTEFEFAGKIGSIRRASASRRSRQRSIGL
jgi:C-terminal repeat of topoisomerase